MTEGKSFSPGFLRAKDLRLIFFGGKGGVGKTTCAAATALHVSRAFPGRRLLLLSTDPAHSLKDSLEGHPSSDRLQVREFDTALSFLEFRERHEGILREIALRGSFLDEEDVSGLLGLTLPGLDELLAFLELVRRVDEGEFDLVLVDTAPTGHTLRLLTMPDFMDRWLRALDALAAKDRYMRRVLAGNRRTDEVDGFLEDLGQGVLRMRRLLRDGSRCRFVPVLEAERLSVLETLNFLGFLKRLGMTVRDAVVNGLCPPGDCPFCTSRWRRQLRELRGVARRWDGYVLWGVPLHPVEIRGTERLEKFWAQARFLDLSPPAIFAAPVEEEKGVVEEVRVERPAPLPGEGTRLLLFAGKGGVGKTTLACAAALRLAEEGRGEVLVFSADPAHSLGHCLDRAVGSEPVGVGPGLSALEIDAEALLKDFKERYREEVEETLASMLHGMDLTFDREAMERVLDLSPPGLDELMALIRAVDLLSDGPFRLLVMDSAPTGHLVRLLELPEIVDAWLKTFFSLFLKYRNIFRLPRTSRRLVQLSKGLKELRAVLGDPSRTGLCAVSILTEMALEETKDLMEAGARLGVSSPAMFLNQAAPSRPCFLCSAIHDRQWEVKAKFQSAFPSVHRTLVYRGEPPPRGTDRLRALGKALFSEGDKSHGNRVREDQERCFGIPGR